MYFSKCEYHYFQVSRCARQKQISHADMRGYICISIDSKRLSVRRDLTEYQTYHQERVRVRACACVEQFGMCVSRTEGKCVRETTQL